jgi:septum formation protein
VEPHEKTDFSYSFVENLAYNKALNVAQKIKTPAKIIGADTIVVINNKILGKPQSQEHAYEMLKTLSGKTHFVVTSIAVIDTPSLEFKIKSTTTYVTFKKLSDEQINHYITDFKPFDKAGSYGIQELPDGFIEKVDGSLDNVIGLPSKTLKELLEK